MRNFFARIKGISGSAKNAKKKERVPEYERRGRFACKPAQSPGAMEGRALSVFFARRAVFAPLFADSKSGKNRQPKRLPNLYLLMSKGTQNHPQRSRMRNFFCAYKKDSGSAKNAKKTEMMNCGSETPIPKPGYASMTPEPTSSSPSYHAANCPGVMPRWGSSKSR